jgi:hypothetical protein
MSSVPEIEAAISKLSREELTALRNWFQEFDAEAWDRQLEDDVRAAWMSGAKKRFEIYATDVAGICEAPRQPEVLGFLRRASRKYPEACRREVRVTQKRSAASISAF